jgi:predicted phosphodiesterase
MIYVTGDIHGDHDIRKLNRKFVDGRDLTKNDYVICTGDFGLIWDVNQSGHTEQYWLDWLAGKNWTTLFLDGNHENFDRLNALPQGEMFGGKVGIVNDSIIHLKRGEIYEIEGNRIFTFGGAESIDKMFRTIRTSWWPEEVPSYAEMMYGLENLKRVENQVDFILTHTGPERIINMIPGRMVEKLNDPTIKFLEHVSQIVSFKRWFFGHMHVDMSFESGRYICQYQDVGRLI